MDGDPKMLMEMIMKALQVSGYSDKDTGEDYLAGMDPGNQVKGWSGISLTRDPDDRPTLADKDYLIEKLALNEGQEMPRDSSDGGGYARPF